MRHRSKAMPAFTAWSRSAARRVLSPGRTELCKLLIRRRILHLERKYQRHAFSPGGGENAGAPLPLLFRGIERDVRPSGDRPAERKHAIPSAFLIRNQ